MRTLLAALCSVAVLSAAPAFTIEQVLGSPYPEGLVASPRKDAIAWVQMAKGVRNVWVARAPGYSASQATAFAADDGQEITELVWNAAGTAVYFTRGGGPNGRGEIPNPLSIPGGVKEEVWVLPLPGGPARKLADGHSPTPSPDGSNVAFVQGGQIWSVAQQADAKPAQLIHARGSASQLAWSPDSRKLAFTSTRAGHGFIGVYSVADKALTYLDASVDRDQSPAWSPDGTKLAFLRLPSGRYVDSWGPKRTGEPWSIRIADPITGKGREVWRANAGMGSVFWSMVAENQVLWTADGRIVFPWEGDGWLHLYSVAEAGGTPVALTPGSFEVEHVALAADGKSVVFSSNQADTDRRHLWTVPVSGGTARRLTPGSGLEWSPTPLADGKIALLHSDSRSPARAAILENSTIRDLAPATMPRDFPSAALVEPQAVEFPAADGLPLHGQVFLPPAGTGTRHPAVVFFHGGSRRQMYLGWHNMFYYHQAYGFNQYLASKGYVVLSVNYRSGIGYGEAFREALHYGATGGSEYADVQGSALYLRTRPDVDPARIGAWGGSYGGYLTALGLARSSDLYKVGVDLHGVHDWNLEIRNYAPDYDPQKRLEFFQTAFTSSPMAYVSTWKSPVLLIHGDDDRNVEFSNTILLAEALRKQGVYFEQLIFPDEIHDFLVHADWLKAYNAADEFLGRFLKP
jgi:dipeptidyl aminopeptidase/acylaminoacyl peptidase